ncbi:MAG TPA: VOC family protein, partial [Acidimicrobiales bacterium]
AGWADAGFAVEDDLVALGSVRIRTATGAGTGILAWSLSGVEDGAIDGLLTVAGEPANEPTRHPNRTVAIDHLVVASPDLDRTTEALGAFGVELRRRRDAGRMEQRFFRLGPVILELIGQPGEHRPEPASFWGLALTVDDIDVTAALLGDHLGPVSEAVQPGRRIATLRHDALDIPVPIAFLTPNPAPSTPP